MKISGLNELQKEFANLQKNAEKLEGLNCIPFDDLFNHTFMMTYTKFNSIDDFFNNSQFDTNNFDEINDSELDEYVNKFSSFANWNDMMESATVDYIEKHLFQ
ncbi:hypothetical protein [Fundicoccus culcitae]|uniref:Phage protein n=1 Tax=Fundicoccus culcitae TaxID=2969821 RepID=A0ABY5P7M7_9LACT|nr:hypothetical protein [Fundicoccus culcitae]UUX34716.1 hypothetical protein NRE15_03435 [Fundicoccus culcitae]